MKLQLLSQDHIQKHTLSVYALSCAYRLDDVARIAARASLALPDHLEYVKELDLLVITVRTYHNLLDFRARCVNTIRPTMLWHGKPPHSQPTVDARPGRPSRAGVADQVRTGKPCVGYHAHRWYASSCSMAGWPRETRSQIRTLPPSCIRHLS
ncbi:hypothetical protein C8Q76DRAFT_175609 [Earliella scabrosa]|nr:hypothetical protein C8Q76DRAFT_175609 [Earliella scabrosa]